MTTRKPESMQTNGNAKKRISMTHTRVRPLACAAKVTLLLLLGLGLALPAFADTVTIRPDSLISAGGWTLGVGDVNDNSDATYATIPGVLSTFTVSMANNAVYSGATINSATLWVRAEAFGSNPAEKITFGTSQPTVSVSAATNVSRGAVNDYSFVPAGISTSGDVDAMEVDVTTDTMGGSDSMRVYDVWVVVDYTPAAAPNQINSCDGCHGQPPIEAAARSGATGAIVGSHAAHSAYACTTCHPNNVVLNHRGAGSGSTAGQIELLANIEGGSYSKGTAFAQANDINGTGLGFCSNVTCHGGAATPQWGDATGLSCDSCHQAPPTGAVEFAHNEHYAAKNWTYPDPSGTYCSQCHPDNTAGHSDVTDGTILVNAGLTPSGATPAITCGSAPALGCHNGKATPAWNTVTAISCTQCHAAGGTDPGDPTSGLHDETPTVSAVIHNPSDPNFAGCDTCHTVAPLPGGTHYDTNLDTPATFAAGVNYAPGTPPTCTAACHSENGTSGPWARKWHEDSDQVTGAECAGCHGDWNTGWNGGVTHRTDSGVGSVRATHSTGTLYECKDCHAIEGSGYTFTIGSTDWGGASNHGNGTITMNTDPAHTFARGTGGNAGLSGCAPCHAQYDGTDGAANQHSFTTTGWNLDPVDGDLINAGCDSCHGGSGQYWPNGASYPDRAGRHDLHITRLAAKLSITLPGSDAQQKQMCDYCHNDPAGAGGGGHYEDPWTAPANVGGFNKFWDASADATATYTTGNQTCANQCHNGKTTIAGTYGWNDATTSDCTMCHTAGGGVANEIINPTSGLHAANPRVSGMTHDQTLDAAGCQLCHTASPSSAHLDGNPDTSAPTITISGVTGFNDAVTPPTCATACHADTGSWERKWHGNSENSDGTECAGCHGTFFTGFNTGVSARHQTATSGDPGGQIQSNHDTGAGGQAGKLCGTCHAYDGADGLGHKWATHHLNGTIELSDQASFSDDGTTVSCNACHTTPYGTADGQHSFTDAGLANGWGRAFVAGPSAGCTGCHNAHGTGKAGVGPDSPHVATTRGGSFNACEDCHPGGSTGSQHSATGVISVPNNTTVGINYQTGVNGYSGYSGIVLGGDHANANPSGKTEAEWCWGCHEAQTPDVSEWDGSSATYDLGTVTINDLNWLTTSWSSGRTEFAYKNGKLTNKPTVASPSVGTTNGGSTHGVKGGSVGVDAVANIGCSYCHDVHDTGGGTNDQNPPYLRGSWQSNPFPEDGAPRSGAGQTINSGYFGAVPRGSQNNNYGGYQINQNNTGATVLNATNGAGLCELCHGNGDGTFSSSEIDSLDNNGSAASDWVAGSNSHARVVFGGSGSGAFNLYDEDIRLGQNFATTSADGGLAGLPSMAYKQLTGGADGYGFRGTDGRSFGDTPSITGNSRPYGYNQYGWGATVNGTTVDANYHSFSCSKCHNPHASRLPRLLITNCLDTKNNTWDNTLTTPSQGTSNGQGTHTVQAENGAVPYSNATSAQNCHRLSDPNFTQANGDGWNNVTPWQ